MAKKSEKSKKDAAEQPTAVQASAGICVAGHPRSAGLVRRAKGWGGVVGLVLATYLAWNAGVPPLDAMMRGLAGGVAGYVALWAIAVTVARQLVIADVRARYARASAAADAAVGDGS